MQEDVTRTEVLQSLGWIERKCLSALDACGPLKAWDIAVATNESARLVMAYLEVMNEKGIVVRRGGCWDLPAWLARDAQ
jgi:hypothetical protein